MTSQFPGCVLETQQYPECVSAAGLWGRGDFQGEAGSEEETGEQLSTTLLITGPPGVGKTASVYACALELGFKVSGPRMVPVDVLRLVPVATPYCV